MNDKYIIEILSMIENEKISTDEGIELIKKNKFNEKDNNFEENNKSKSIKIKIIDGENGKKINLPAIPINLAASLIPLTIKINNKNNDYKSEKLSGNEIKQIFKTLKNIPPTKLVDIKDDEGTIVEIYTK